MGVRLPWVILAAVLLAPSTAGAGDHQFETFIGPSYLNAKGSSANLGGWHIAGAATTHRWRRLSFIGDLSVHFLGEDDSGGDLTQVSFMAGPRWTLLGGHEHHHMPFVHVVVLGAVLRSRETVQSTAGAMAVGVGYDFAPGKKKNWGSRIQVDYIQPLSSDIRHSVRVSAGLVYRFTIPVEEERHREEERRKAKEKPS